MLTLDSGSRPIRSVLPAAALVVGAGCFAWTATHVWRFALDDTFITLRYARHLAPGWARSMTRASRPRATPRRCGCCCSRCRRGSGWTRCSPPSGSVCARRSLRPACSRPGPRSEPAGRAPRALLDRARRQALLVGALARGWRRVAVRRFNDVYWLWVLAPPQSTLAALPPGP